MKQFTLCLVLLLSVTSITPFESNVSTPLTNDLLNYQTTTPQHSKIVIGYFAQWSIYTRGYKVLDVEADKLTHLLYAFYNPVYDANSDTASLESLDAWADTGHNNNGLLTNETVKGNIGELKILKQNNPHLKILISVGGWTKSQHFPAIAASQNARKTLAQSMVNFMNDYPWIDGFDLDWEFPVQGGTEGQERVNGITIPAQPHTPNDHKNLVYLLKEMRETFNASGMQSKEISIAMGNNVEQAAGQFIGPANEAVYGMSDNVMDFCDFVTFFGYDFGGNWFDITCYNAPLFGGDHVNDPLHNANGRNQVLSELVDVYLTDVGIPADKLVMGLPFYGKLFEGVAATNSDPSNPGLYESAPRVPNPNCGLPEPPIGTWDVTSLSCEKSGAIEFCDLSQGLGTNPHHFLDSNNPLIVSNSAITDGWVRHWDDVAKVPYLYNATQKKFISYDDSESIGLKVKYALSQNLGGVMIWELSQDARNSDKGLLDAIETTFVNATFNLTLNFKDQSDVALPGVTVELLDANGTSLETLTTDANGQVIFNNQAAFVAYTINYSYTNHAFLPSNVSFAVLEFDGDKTINIIGSNQTSQIQGSVKENGQLLSNVDVVLSDDNAAELERLTSSDGNFDFSSVIDNLNYSLTAEKDYYTFSSLTYNSLNSDQLNQEITATRNSHTISGNVSSGTMGMQAVNIQLTGNGQTHNTTTDSNGDYIFNNVPAGYDYVVTPSVNSTVFKPTSISFNMLNANGVANFEENKGLIYGTVKNGQTPTSGAKISLIVPWTDNNHGYQNIVKTTNANGEYFYTETELDGYNVISELILYDYDNNGITYYPTDLKNIAITTTPQEYNFNSQQVNPEITITAPNQAVLANAYGASVNLEALVGLSFDDGTTTLSNVTFEIDNTTITNTNTQNSYSASWSPQDSDYGTTHIFKVTAQSSNNKTASETFQFTLECTGSNCPNLPPTIQWDAPTNTTINQNSGFQAIPIEVTVTDTDGTVASVSIEINGTTTTMTAGANNTYSYNFTPTNHQAYPLTITATDDVGGTTTHSKTLTIIDSQFVPLPSGNIILGYAHSWENAGAPFLYFRDMLTSKYNVVMYSFIETVGQNGYTPQLTINTSRYLTGGSYDKQLLKDDINSLRSQGIPVIVSIGGQNGHVELSTVAEKDEFVQGLKDIVDEYNFDGIDLDFEGGSMNFGAGALTDFSYTGISAFPKLKNVVDAFKEIKLHYGSNFILTCAPETFYVQVGKSTYSETAGSFLPVIHNLRSELDLIMVQLYNTGSVTALDSQAYSQATPDFLTSMSDMLITGFDVASTGFNFPGLPASKIMVGIPSCTSAAPAGGYIQPSETIKALNYLRFGTTFSGRNYDLQNGAHPSLRGVMTWSVNWDAAANCASEYEFSTNYYNYFSSTAGIDEMVKEDLAQIYPNPFDHSIKIKSAHIITEITIFDINGKKLYHKLKPDTSSIDLSTLESSLYIMELKTESSVFYKKILKK
ncbi:glycosyl hydrolase family 18 protein [Flavobacteriaceae bacterium]|nr:glycosyl hydrolase family 18 protein [Flavobacteriaceae bacterium]